jgi:hypothetical protein
MIELPGNQVIGKEAAVMLVTDQAIQLYQDLEFSVDTRVSINKNNLKKHSQFYAYTKYFDSVMH